MSSAEKEQSPEPPSPFTLLPEEVLVNIIARVPRSYHPTVSFVSRRFRSVIASQELYMTRSLLSCTEHCLSVVLSNHETHENRLYILHRNINNSARLVLIPSLPAMPLHGNFVSVGSKFYVFGGYSDIASMISVDSRSHTVQTLPSLPIPMACIVTGNIDGKIYVIGDHQENGLSGRVMVLDTETETWETEITKVDMGLGRLWYSCVVMNDKMYMMDGYQTIVYSPKDRKWEEDEMLNSRVWSNVCVIDDISYSYNDSENKLEAYDPKCWGVVEGAGMLLPGNHWWRPHTVSYGKKLVVFLIDNEGDKESRITSFWCAEIAIERR